MSYWPSSVCCISQSWEKPLEHPFCCSKLPAVTHLAGMGRTCMSEGGGPLSWRRGHPWPSRCLDFPGQIWRGVPGAGTAAVPDVPEGHWLLRVGAVGGCGWRVGALGAGQAVSLLWWSHGAGPGEAPWSWHKHLPWHRTVNRQLVMCSLSYVQAGELWVQPQAGKTAWQSPPACRDLSASLHVFPSVPWAKVSAPPAPHRAAGVPQDSSWSSHGGLGEYWGCRSTPGLLSIPPWGS